MRAASLILGLSILLPTLATFEVDAASSRLKRDTRTFGYLVRKLRRAEAEFARYYSRWEKDRSKKMGFRTRVKSKALRIAAAKRKLLKFSKVFTAKHGPEPLLKLVNRYGVADVLAGTDPSVAP